jgi:hypothetical protein
MSCMLNHSVSMNAMVARNVMKTCGKGIGLFV